MNVARSSDVAQPPLMCAYQAATAARCILTGAHHVERVAASEAQKDPAVPHRDGGTFSSGVLAEKLISQRGFGNVARSEDATPRAAQWVSDLDAGQTAEENASNEAILAMVTNLVLGDGEKTVTHDFELSKATHAGNIDKKGDDGRQEEEEEELLQILKCNFRRK